MQSKQYYVADRRGYQWGLTGNRELAQKLTGNRELTQKITGNRELKCSREEGKLPKLTGIGEKINREKGKNGKKISKLQFSMTILKCRFFGARFARHIKSDVAGRNQ